jgi:xylulokinase
MSLLGIDVGTTGCKAAAFTEDGAQITFAYDEYDFARPRPGWAELDPRAVWKKIAGVIRSAAAVRGQSPVSALSVSSFGEAVVPVGRRAEVLGPSILNSDVRGLEYLDRLGKALPAEDLYRINGNKLANFLTLPKLCWIRDNEPDLYRQAALFLPWGGFVPWMLGAEPSVDFSLAGRTLLFDLDRGSWSAWVADRSGIDIAKLPRPVASGTVIGRVSSEAARELGLPPAIPIVAGAHDQCANAVGAGVITERSAMFGMGSYLCLVPSFARRPDPGTMLALGINTERHAAPGLFVSFLYNYGGIILKWFRDTFARMDKADAAASGRDIYEILIREAPAKPSPVFILPRFGQTGPPDFSPNRDGVIAGLSLETTRGDICKAVLEGTVFHIRELVQHVAGVGMRFQELQAVGGGSKSAPWVQLCCDVLGVPLSRLQVMEAGCLGAAVIAGVGSGAYTDIAQGVTRMVHTRDRFVPDSDSRALYDESFARYLSLRASMTGWSPE